MEPSGRKGVQDASPQRVPPWQANYLELKAIKAQLPQDKLSASLKNAYKYFDRRPGPERELTLHLDAGPGREDAPLVTKVCSSYCSPTDPPG